MTSSLSAEHALSIVENCPLPLLVVDTRGRAVNCNRAFRELVGETRAGDLLGHTAADMGDHPTRMLLEDVDTLCWTDHHAIQRHFEIRRIALSAPAGGQARLFIDISRQVVLEHAHEAVSEELKQHILTDAATGLLNRRGIVLALEPQVARSRRYNSPIAVIMLDVQCQESLEHVRVQAARLLKDQLRWADLVGVSDEHAFILVLPETSAEAAQGLGEKLKRQLEAPTFSTGSAAVQASFAISAWRRNDSADTLLKRARMALSRTHAEGDHQSIAS